MMTTLTAGLLWGSTALQRAEAIATGKFDPPVQWAVPAPLVAVDDENHHPKKFLLRHERRREVEFRAPRGPSPPPDRNEVTPPASPKSESPNESVGAEWNPHASDAEFLPPQPGTSE